jgi:hypothetical protein
MPLISIIRRLAGSLRCTARPKTGGIATGAARTEKSIGTPFTSVQCMIAGAAFVRSEYISPGLERDEGDSTSGDLAHSVEGGRFALLGRADGIARSEEASGPWPRYGKSLKLFRRAGRACDHIPADKGRRTRSPPRRGNTDETIDTKGLSDSLEPYAVPRRIKDRTPFPRRAWGNTKRRSIESC